MTEARHDERRRRFEIEEDGATAILTYVLRDGAIVFTHTIVPEEIEGRGVGGRLAKAGLAYARENGLNVVPQCSFVRGYIERHPEYADLLAT
ncbi:MAG: uncharacterized protein QOC65_31 [Sphingomonadales bacterium]|nr:uncharacterized protein [Sphingomonadales bacterium]